MEKNEYKRHQINSDNSKNKTMKNNVKIIRKKILLTKLDVQTMFSF